MVDVKAILHSNLPHMAKLVLLYLCENRDESGSVTASYWDVQRDVMISQVAIHRAMQYLLRHDLIRIHTPHSGRRARVYTLPKAFRLENKTLKPVWEG